MKKYLFLLFSVFIFCSCASLDKTTSSTVKTDNTDKKEEAKPSRRNVNLFENWEIPTEIKQLLEEKCNKELSKEDGNSFIGKLVIFSKTKTYIPAEKIFVESVLWAGGGLVYVASRPYGRVDGYYDRYDNLAFLIYSDSLNNGQAISVSENEEIKQIGTISIQSDDIMKTFPIVILVNEETLPIWKEKMESRDSTEKN